MVMGRRCGDRQQALFVSADGMRTLGNPFYRALNRLLDEHGFDGFVEGLCKEFYAERMGRPGIAPGVYSRMLMVGYLEGLGSEHGIAWRCDDSKSLCEFSGYDLWARTPGHSTLSKTRRRLSLEVHEAVFTWVLTVLDESGLLNGTTVGVDSTMLEANAAMRSIVRRDSGDGYKQWLEQMAKASGIETPTQADLVKLDRKRKKKASNKDWVHPRDPGSRIAKMKNGSTHLAHKLEHAVDLDSAAVVAVTVQTTDGGDTASLSETLDEVDSKLGEVGKECLEVVGDKGYHSNKTMVELEGRGVRSYVSEPDRGRRNWKRNPEAQKPTYANRRRIRGERGKRLLRRRGEKVERAFAHMLETGGLRRSCVRGHHEIRKRMLLHAAAFNLGLVMSKRFGFGKPRALQRLTAAQTGLTARRGTAQKAFHVFSVFVSAFLELVAALTNRLWHSQAAKPAISIKTQPL